MINLVDAINQLLDLITKPLEVWSWKRLAAAGDYTAEDVMSEVVTIGGTPFIFELASKSGYIEKAVALCSTTALTPRLTLYLFNQYPTCEMDDNDPNTAPIVADRFSYQGKIDFPAMEDLGTGMSNTLAAPSTYGNLPLPYYAPKKKLYGVLVTRDAITGQAAGMTMTIGLQVRQD